MRRIAREEVGLVDNESGSCLLEVFVEGKDLFRFQAGLAKDDQCCSN